jgi:hypothetical protein
LTVEDETVSYASSEALDRVFCKRGTRLFSWWQWLRALRSSNAAPQRVRTD